MVWTWKTAFIKVFKNVQSHLCAFFRRNPINVCKSISVCEVIFLSFVLVAVLGCERCFQGKNPQYRASHLWGMSVRNTTACSEISPSKNQFSRRHGRRLYWLVRSSSEIMQCARELPADSLTVSLCNLITHGSRDSTVWNKPRETPNGRAVHYCITSSASQATRTPWW